MNKRVVETFPTSGAMQGPEYRIDSDIENISLIWDIADRSLTLSDVNLDYSQLPYQMEEQLVKKVFVTYNGLSSQNGMLLETVVMTSGSEENLDQDPGYANSNEWGYQPGYFRILNNPTLTDPADWTQYPYDVSQGITVVKEFLGAGSGFEGPLYTAFYRAPQRTVVEFTNVESNTVYTDGWYTSYVIAVKKFVVMTGTLSNGDVIPNLAIGHIYWDNDAFYKNITGSANVYDDIAFTHLPSNDIINWGAPLFTDWVALMQNHVDGDGQVQGEVIYYIENQHLVTVDLSAAIEREFLNICNCCVHKDFGLSSIDLHVKLVSKWNGAFYNFHNCFFKDAQCILESARPICAECSVHKNENLPLLGTLNNNNKYDT